VRSWFAPRAKGAAPAASTDDRNAKGVA
jgi:hypothetical protein